LLAAISGCASIGDLQSFESDDATVRLESDEQRIWYDANRFDRQLANSRAVYDDPALQAYLQSVTDRLFPEFADTLRIYPFRGFQPNAFVLPNGSIYFDVGLLTRLDNEAQLAAIIGHEGAHFMERHSLKSLRVAKQNMNAAIVFQTVTGVPVVGQALAYSSMMGYSRDFEREADLLGYERMASAGYDVREAMRPFERLASEAAALNYSVPIFFSSHPRMSERVASFRSLSLDAPAGGERNGADYLARTRRAAGDTLEAYLERREPEVVVFLLEREGLLQRFPESFQYYLAEAYRLRGQPGDDVRAEQAYRATLDTCPEHAPTYRAMGLLRMREGQRTAACDYLTRYLELAPDAPDRAYVELYLSRLREDTP
jgi:predicted Zn-dependent protease